MDAILFAIRKIVSKPLNNAKASTSNTILGIVITLIASLIGGISIGGTVSGIILSPFVLSFGAPGSIEYVPVNQTVYVYDTLLGTEYYLNVKLGGVHAGFTKVFTFTITPTVYNDTNMTIRFDLYMNDPYIKDTVNSNSGFNITDLTNSTYDILDILDGWSGDTIPPGTSQIKIIIWISLWNIDISPISNSTFMHQFEARA
jgi:hypothetical protein